MLLATSSGQRYLGVVANRCAIPHRQNTGIVGISSWTAHKAMDDIYGLYLLSGNWLINEFVIGATSGTYAEQGTGASQTRRAQIYQSGSYNRFAWGGGNTTVTEADGAVDVLSDKLVAPGGGILLARGSTFLLGQYVHNAAGVTLFSTIGNNQFNTALGDKSRLDDVDGTADIGFSDGGVSGASFGAAGGYGDFPYGLLAVTRNSSYVIFGNSIDEAIYDTVDSSGDMGYVARALSAAGIGYIKTAVSGDSIAKFNASPAKRLTLPKYATHGSWGGPTNDSQVSGLPAQEAVCQTAWQATIAAGGPQGFKVYSTVPLPETSGAATLVNQTDQTIAKDFETFGINPYIRGVPSPLSGVFDPTLSMATGTRGNRYWNADGTLNKWCGDLGSDLVHPNQYAYLQAVAAGVVPAAALLR